jgi:hypothetical protein
LSHHAATLGIQCYVDENTLIINNDCVVHQVKFLFIVELTLMCHIIPWLVYFSQGFVNEFDAT